MKTTNRRAWPRTVAALTATALVLGLVVYMVLTGPGYAGVWTNPDGVPAERGQGMDTRHELRVAAGPDHCGWQRATFMSLAWPPGATTQLGEQANEIPTRQYVRDPDGVVDAPELRRGFAISSTLPDDAVATGFHRGDVELWLGRDRGEQFVYVAWDDHVERWPRSQPPIGCE